MQQISRDKFDRFPRATTEFTLGVLDRYGLRDHWPARPTLTPQIRFFYIGSRFCSTLPSDPTSRRRPCVSLSLHLYQVVKRTCTSKLSHAHKKRAFRFPGTLWKAALKFMRYALTGAGTGAVSGPAPPGPPISPTLKRTNRRMEMFSPSLAIAAVIISPIVTLSSLM